MEAGNEDGISISLGKDYRFSNKRQLWFMLLLEHDLLHVSWCNAIAE